MTLREAIKVLIEEEHLGDYVYSVRDHAIGSGDGYTGESWDHPRVKRFSEAVTVLEEFLKVGGHASTSWELASVRGIEPR